ncbi:MAG: flavodoxin family protein [Dissulfurimicrobium sp.]|uniref:flavodoxin family protein n=1 Tax=Dissulfurimicrobium TaxID=1769732 RepID=UPI003C730034
MKKILAVMGSPRRDGNTNTILDRLIFGAKEAGVDCEKVDLNTLKMSPCIECGGCNETGICIIKDDMTPIYQKIATADWVILASPIFFYNITSRTQALIERSQACWAGKYLLKRGPYGGRRRKGIFISLGATKGKLLFDGVTRTVRYFFDAIDADFEGALLYRGIDTKGAINKHPSALNEAQELGGCVARGDDVSSLPYLYRP